MRISFSTFTQMITALAIGIPVLEWVATGRTIQLSHWEHVLLGLLALGFAYLGTRGLIRDLKRPRAGSGIEA